MILKASNLLPPEFRHYNSTLKPTIIQALETFVWVASYYTATKLCIFKGFQTCLETERKEASHRKQNTIILNKRKGNAKYWLLEHYPIVPEHYPIVLQ